MQTIAAQIFWADFFSIFEQILLKETKQILLKNFALRLQVANSAKKLWANIAAQKIWAKFAKYIQLTLQMS